MDDEQLMRFERALIVTPRLRMELDMIGTIDELCTVVTRLIADYGIEDDSADRAVEAARDLLRRFADS